MLGWREISVSPASVNKKSERNLTTHECSYAFTIPVHWNRQKPTKRLTGGQDQKRYFYTSVQHHPVREKSKSVKNHVLHEVCQGKDVQCISAMCVEKICDRGSFWYDQTKIYNTGSNKIRSTLMEWESDERDAGHCSYPRHVVSSSNWEV